MPKKPRVKGNVLKKRKKKKVKREDSKTLKTNSFEGRQERVWRFLWKRDDREGT